MPPLFLADPNLDSPVTGAPYLRNDIIEIEIEPKCWITARVSSVIRLPSARFGLRFLVTVTGQDTPEYTLAVDDNGYNYTRGQRVRPSTYIED